VAALILFGVVSWSTAMADPIHDAAGAGKVEALRRLLAEGADVNGKSDTGATPLHAAAAWGHRDIAELLLSKGADVDAKDWNGMTPLHFAANGDHKNLSVLLLEKGAAVNAKALNGWTPLHVAAVWGHTSVAMVLIARGADVNARADGSALGLRVTETASRCHKDISSLLKKKGAGVGAKAGNGMTPLHAAVLNGQSDMADLLRKHGAGE
jgi:ankyrin repeat protein